MKRLLTLAIVLGLVAYGTSVAKANIVIGDAVNNGNMDAIGAHGQLGNTPNGYVVNAFYGTPGFNDGASSETFANVLQPGGTGVFFKPFYGGATWPANPAPFISVDLYQDNPGTAGMKYTLTGWFGAGAGYEGLVPGNGVQSQLAIDFLNSGGTKIGGNTLDLQPGLVANQVFNVPGGTPFGYAEYMVMATAPAGTATVRARGSMINAFGNPAGGDQAFVTDYWTLNCTPEPTSIVLGLIGAAGVFGLARRRS
jgi:hypothetical protein